MPKRLMPTLSLPAGHARFRDVLITDALAPMGRGGWRSGALDDFAAASVRHEARRVARVPAAIWTHCLAVMPVRSTPREM
jgi:hypothetical protein